jgi:glutamate 5-kinase
VTDVRSAVARARRVVVKIGSSTLVANEAAAARLAGELAEFCTRGYGFVLVTSGAIAIGCTRLGYRTRPKEMARLQAAAAAGQSVLMRRYDEAFAESGLTAAQVLLTHADLADRERANNAREALGELLEAGAVPVINENDTVSTEEIKFGDNDQLAGMVTPLVGADLLILLTDVDGVLDAKGKRIAVMHDGVDIGKVEKSGAKVGTGGMQSKLAAARMASRSGAAVVIAPAQKPQVISQVLAGKDIGTYLPAVNKALRARKHWIAYTLRPRGAVLLDEGAAKVMQAGKCSLLPIGVLGVRGDFFPGDSVELVAPGGLVIGRGLARLSAVDVARAAGKKGEALAHLFAASHVDVVVVHKDDLVTDL